MSDLDIIKTVKVGAISAFLDNNGVSGDLFDKSEKLIKILNNLESKFQSNNNSPNTKEKKQICSCGDHIELTGDRDYKYENGKYYCTECM
jgi:hypothetical protein